MQSDDLIPRLAQGFFRLPSPLGFDFLKSAVLGALLKMNYGLEHLGQSVGDILKRVEEIIRTGFSQTFKPSLKIGNVGRQLAYQWSRVGRSEIPAL